MAVQTAKTTGTEPFLVLPENRLAFTAVNNLAAGRGHPGVRRVLLCGPPGSGKRHLTTYAQRLLRQNNPQAKIQHWDADQFKTAIFDAITAKRLSELQAAWNELDLFIFRGIESLAGSPDAQLQLQRIIDELGAKQSAVLVTSIGLPGTWRGTRPSLANRVRAGVVAPLKSLGPSSRGKLLEHFCTTRGILAGVDGLKELAARMAAPPGELLEAVLAIDQEARSRRCDLDLGLVKQYLSRTRQGKSWTLAGIAKVVARHFSLTTKDLQSPARDQHLALPRQCAMLLARELTGLGTVQIGEFFGRNHSTVIHACEKLRVVIPKDPALRSHLTQIRSRLGAGDLE